MGQFVPDLSLTSPNMVISLINHDLQLNLQENEVEISEVKISDEMDRDTTAVVKIKRPGNRTLQIYYNRLTAERWLNQQPILVKVSGNGFTTHDLIEAINSVCSSNLLPDDLINETFTLGKDAVTLKVSPESLGYKGQFSVLVFGKKEVPFVTKKGELIVTADNRVLIYGGINEE